MTHLTKIADKVYIIPTNWTPEVDSMIERICTKEWDNIPIQIMNSKHLSTKTAMTTVPARYNKNSRIEKKWINKYGYRKAMRTYHKWVYSLKDNAILVSEQFVTVNPTTYALLLQNEVIHIAKNPLVL